MHEKQTNPETLNYDETIQAMAAFFGISNLSITLAPGKGWSCRQTDRGIEILVDPLQLLREKAPTNEAAPTTAIRPEEILHTAAHEIGHARDILDGSPMTPSSQEDHFFWNTIHDSVIDTRLRHIPLLNGTTTELYNQVLFPENNISTAPSHVQFMYGVLLSSVVSELSYTYSPQVQRALDSLTHYQLTDEQSVSILDTLTDLHTDIPSRIAIAKQFIMPLYKKMLSEDKKKNENKKTDTNDNSQDFSEYYDSATKCSQPSQKPQTDTPEDSDSKSDDKNNSNSESTDNGDTQDIAGQIAKQMKEAAQQNKSTDKIPDSQPNDASGVEKTHQETKANLAGIIKKEMELASGSADAYADTLLTYRSVISQTADIFLQLSSYADITATHRYLPRADQHGRRLHPTRLATAAIQASTRHPESIWQPTAAHSEQQSLRFGGLDIHLLVDVSSSMESGSKADNASACAVILLEALELAMKRAESNENEYTTPDVRSQIIAFGSSSVVLSPLSIGTTSLEKGKTFHNLRYPQSSSTYINKSLLSVQQSATESPSRDHIAIIITDGCFSDFDEANITSQRKIDNLALAQLNIDCGSTPITNNSVDIQSPNDLPYYLLGVLQDYLNQYE